MTGTIPAAAVMPVFDALPVVCSTNQGIATRAAAFPAMEMASADNIATSGTRVRPDDRLLTSVRLAWSADPCEHPGDW